jgi:hypothetical protein
MKNPKGSYNDDALNDLLKQFMLDEAAGGRTADDWLESEAESVFSSEPEHVPTKERERALIAGLNEHLGIGNKGGKGMLWKGSALGLLLLGIVATTIMLWPETEAPTAASGNAWTNEGYEYANVPYYDGKDYQKPVPTADTAANNFLASNTLPTDNVPMKRPVVRQELDTDTVPVVANVFVPAKTKKSTKNLIKELKRKLELFTEQFPAERLYAQTDRTDYFPGQDLWFSAYLLNEADMKPSDISSIIKTELLNASGQPVALKEWVATDGRATGNLTIPQDIASGTYLFRAYTAWQYEMPGSKIFETPIVVQQPGQVLRLGDAATLPASLPSMEFYPEGGDLVVGLTSRVAFQVPTSLGLRKGTIVDNSGAAVTTFTANAEGQGVFTITPETDKQYFATADGISIQLPLPTAYPSGYVLEVLGQEGNWVKVNVRSTKAETVALAGQMRGTMYYGAEQDLEPGDNYIRIPVYNLPAGVLHLSLFDADGVGHAERLVFVNKNKKLNVTIKTDKANYLPREKVTAQITVTDDKGRPVKTTLSLTAVDDLLAHTQNTNILSALLLEPDLGDVAHHAGYLFDPANKNADQQLDLLLMTQGWRRFTWKEVYYNQRPPVAVAPETAVLRGKVIDAVTRKPLKGVKITSTKSLGISTETAADGSFYIPNLDLSQLRELDLSYKVGLMTMVINHYQNDLVIEFGGDARKVYQPQANSNQHPVLTGRQKAPKGTAIAGQVLNAYGDGVAGATVTVTAANGKVLTTQTDAQGYYLAQTETPGSHKVTVDAAGYHSYQNPSVKTDGNQFSMLDVLLNYQVDMNMLSAHFTSHEADTFANRYSFLAGKFLPAYNSPAVDATLPVFGPEVRMPLRDGVTAYYVEGLKMRYNEPLMLPITAIGHMQVFDNGLPSKFDGNGTVMEVTTGVGNGLSGRLKAPEEKPTGFNVRYAQPREYPKTEYTARERTDSRTDLRSTLYWNGNVATDGNGKATVEFYASDDLSAFRMIVEGVGSNGQPGRTEQVVGMSWPFNLQVNMPDALVKGQKIQVPIWVDNYTGKQVTGNFDFTLPDGLKPIWPLAPKEYGLFPQRSDTIKVQFEVIDPMATGTLIVGFTASGYRDTYIYQLPPRKKED